MVVPDTYQAGGTTDEPRLTCKQLYFVSGFNFFSGPKYRRLIFQQQLLRSIGIYNLNLRVSVLL